MIAAHPPIQVAPNPLVATAVTAGALAYAAGVRRLWGRGRRGRGVRVRQVWAFAIGLTALAAALISPIDGLADQLLSVHMVQHVLIMLVAAPLLVVGRPGLVVSAVLPRTWRAWIRHVEHRPGVTVVWSTMSHPLVVWVANLAVLWIWHLPSLYDAALQHPPIHALEHLCFLTVSFAFWQVALAPAGRRRLARGIDVLYVFTAGLAGGAMGALFAFSGSPIYPFYVRTAARWGIAALADQQIAGVIMWIPAGIVTLVAAAALFVQWFGAMERESRRADAAMGLPPIRRAAEVRP
jgi:putative membrane protein